MLNSLVGEATFWEKLSKGIVKARNNKLWDILRNYNTTFYKNYI